MTFYLHAMWNTRRSHLALRKDTLTDFLAFVVHHLLRHTVITNLSEIGLRLSIISGR